MLDGTDVLITGGTGSLGRRLLERLLSMPEGPKRIIILSRDEHKQDDMWRTLNQGQRERVRFFLGDVRDESRLRRAFARVDYVVHAAALKQVPAAEYNPGEAVQTNVLGAMNVINAALDAGVKRVLALSTDKAVNPANLYGATKLCAEKLFTSANSYAGAQNTRFSCVRYGNVMGSRGSVIPLFREQAKAKPTPTFTVTDPKMTRFWISLDGAVDLVLHALARMWGGEVFVPKLPSMNIMDLCKAMLPEGAFWTHEEIGIRAGEKIHETLISAEEASRTREHDWHYEILPAQTPWQEPPHERGWPVSAGFTYTSDRNDNQLSVEELRREVDRL